MGIELAALLLIIAGVVIFGVSLMLRRGKATATASGETSTDASAMSNPGGEARAIAADDLILVPLPNRRDEALVLGSEEALSVLDASGLSRRTSNRAPGPLPQLIRSGMAVGGTAATRHAQKGIDSGRIVALSQETMEQLARGKPVYDKARQMLGVVKGDKGKISHVMRFDRMGAQAVVASNAATLAVTAALSQQLEKIAEQLAEISETLEGMVRDKDRERLAEVMAANEVLMAIADNVRRRGITETDANQLAALRLPVTAKQFEARFKLDEVLGEDHEKLTRGGRLGKLVDLAEKERLDYWLAVRVQADLARTRTDLLNLYWEHHAHPDTAAALNESTEKAVSERQRQLNEVGQTLRALSDPEARTRLDPMRQLSRYRLGKEHAKIDALLARHGQVFAGPDSDPYALIEGAALVVTDGRPSRTTKPGSERTQADAQLGSGQR